MLWSSGFVSPFNLHPARPGIATQYGCHLSGIDFKPSNRISKSSVFILHLCYFKTKKNPINMCFYIECFNMAPNFNIAPNLNLHPFPIWRPVSKWRQFSRWPPFFFSRLQYGVVIAILIWEHGASEAPTLYASALHSI